MWISKSYLGNLKIWYLEVYKILELEILEKFNLFQLCLLIIPWLSICEGYSSYESELFASAFWNFVISTVMQWKSFSSTDQKTKGNQSFPLFQIILDPVTWIDIDLFILFLRKWKRKFLHTGVQEYVTCREGDVRSLPFGDNYFDVVVSAVYFHTVGKEYGPKTVEAAAERMRVLGEMVRVLKPGGVGVVWDLLHVPEYVRRLQELKMEDIRVSERVTAFMVSSHIVSFRKPSQHYAGPKEVRLDWRCWCGKYTKQSEFSETKTK